MAMDLIPPTLGAAVGVGEGIITSYYPGNHRRTIYRAAVAALGLLGEKSLGWEPDVTIGLMASAAALAATSIPYAIHNKTVSGEGGVFPYASPQSSPCVSCTKAGAKVSAMSATAVPAPFGPGNRAKPSLAG